MSEVHEARPAVKPAVEKSTISQATAGLLREFAAECLRIASIKAAHAADDLELGDDLAAEHGIRIAIQHLKEGAHAFRQMQAASSKGAGR